LEDQELSVAAGRANVSKRANVHNVRTDHVDVRGGWRLIIGFSFKSLEG
jgi:hypothetical protein